MKNRQLRRYQNWMIQNAIGLPEETLLYLAVQWDGLMRKGWGKVSVEGLKKRWMPKVISENGKIKTDDNLRRSNYYSLITGLDGVVISK